MMMPCGNGMIDMGEVCDDANEKPSDGCTQCQLDGAADKCPTGEVIQLQGTIVISSTTKGKANATGGDCGGNSAPDMVFQVMPTKTGVVKVKLVAASFDRILIMRPACTLGFGSNPDHTCADGSATLNATWNAETGKPFHVVVSGHSGSNGPFVLTIAY
jgi:cysteine-rich repeat protein